MKRHAKKLSLVLLAIPAFVLALCTAINPKLHAQSQPSGSDQSPASARPSAATPSPAGTVWVNIDTGVYHKQGSRWYGRTKHGKYMLEADALKAGYKPAK